MGLPLLSVLPLAGAARVLDLGTGTGALFPTLRSSSPGAVICGVDNSEGMLRIAQTRGGRCLCVMDAQRLALRSASFDAVVLMFILFHVPDPLGGLVEAARVLRPAGWIGLTTWARDPGLPGVAIWNEELERVGAGPDPRDPAVMQHERVGDRQALARLLEEAGFSSTEMWTGSFEHRWDHESLLSLQLGCGMPRRRLERTESEVQQVCVERVRQRIWELPVEELVWRPEVLFSVAKRLA